MNIILTWLIFTTSLFCVASFLFVGNGVVIPNDPYVFIGSNLTLTCNLTKIDADSDSRYMYFSRKSGEIINKKYVTIVNSRSIQLKFPVTSPDDEGSYVCKLNRATGRPEIIGNQFVTVEYEPKPVEKIDCHVFNWESMTCIWDLGVDFIHPENFVVNLIWTNSYSDRQSECVGLTKTSCTWSNNYYDDKELDPFVSDVVYYMVVVITDNKRPNTDPTQSIKGVQFTIHTSDIVEPAPVSELKASSNSTCVSLSWTHVKNMREKVYRVHFRSQYDSNEKWQIKNVNELEELTMCGLIPHTTYFFNVSCKPWDSETGIATGFWSQGSLISVKTMEDVPSEAPAMLSGSYVEKQYLENFKRKKVMLYWQPVSPRYANGEIESYVLEYEGQNKRQTEHVMGSTYGTLILPLGHSYVVKLYAQTKVGISEKFSRIILPKQEEKPHIPELIVQAHNVSVETRVVLSWIPSVPQTSQFWKEVKSYTVYWCLGFKTEKICRLPIEWKTLPVSQTDYEMTIEDVFESYLFGLSVEVATWSEEIISSGLEWNPCSYVLNWKPEISPKNFRLARYQPDNTLSVEWDKLSCEDTEAYIQLYIISYCQSSKGSTNCTGATKTVKISNKLSEMVLKNMPADQRYKLWIQVESLQGFVGPKSDPVFGIVVDRSLKPVEMVGIIIGAIFVVIIVFFAALLCARRIYKTVKQKYFVPVPIEVPNTLPPLPPIPMPPPVLTPQNSETSSEGIYEKIGSPPSPTSSLDSTGAGVEAPLISTRCRIGMSKGQLYSKKKEQRHSNDSGRGSLSHSADTLLMRLQPAIFAKYRDKKNKAKLYSDSGVGSETRSQPSCAYSTGVDSGMDLNVKVVEVSPYSCVNILDKVYSEKLQRKNSIGSSTHCPDNVNSTSADKSYSGGSTLSLPPTSCRLTTFACRPLDFRTKSADNELDCENKKLEIMKETRELDDSYELCSEDGNLDDSAISKTENEEESTEQPIRSYIRFGNAEGTEISDSVLENNSDKCQCEDHNKKSLLQVSPVDGYIKQEQMVNNFPSPCQCQKAKQKQKYYEDKICLPNNEILRTGTRPVSQVVSVPPHFYGSLSQVPIDPSTTTEL